MRERPAPSYFGKIARVAWREFRYTALTKGFIIGAVAVPAAMFALMWAMPLLLSEKSPPLVGAVAVIDASGAILPRAREIIERPADAGDPEKRIEDLAGELERGGMPPLDAAAALAREERQFVRIDWRTETDAQSLDALKAEIARAQREPLPPEAEKDEAARIEALSGRLVAVAVIPPAALDPASEDRAFDLYVQSGFSPKHVRQLSRALRDAVEDERIARSGLDKTALARLTRQPEPRTMRVSAEGTEAKEQAELRMIVPFAFMLLLWLSVFTSANYLLTTTIEEKSNKVMEVLLAAASPMQLLAGKIAGYATVSLIMLVMYGGLGIAGLAAMSQLGLVPTHHIVYLAVFFVMAYVMVSALMAAVGSAVSDLREAQSLSGPAMMLLLVPLILWAPIIDNPNGPLATISSFVPPLTPFVMILRLTAQTEEIPVWQTALGIAWGFACAFAMLWLAARIFRVGVLMQGKPPTPRELLRWAFVK
ncbi:MAG: ABC transporter permease [Planctomycetota bacterium]